VSTNSLFEGTGRVPEHWVQLLEEHDVQHAALSARGDGGLAMRLPLSGAWEVEWEDGETVLLSRVGPLSVPHPRCTQPRRSS